MTRGKFRATRATGRLHPRATTCLASLRRRSATIGPHSGCSRLPRGIARTSRTLRHAAWKRLAHRLHPVVRGRRRAARASPSSTGNVSSSVRSGTSPPVAKRFALAHLLLGQPVPGDLVRVRARGRSDRAARHSPRASAGRISRSTSCARDAMNSSASARGTMSDARIEQEAPDLVAERRAAGLAQRTTCGCRCAVEHRRAAAELRGLPRALAALEDDEPPAVRATASSRA